MTNSQITELIIEYLRTNQEDEFNNVKKIKVNNSQSINDFYKKLYKGKINFIDENIKN